jgi:hypothetical protein
MEREEIVRADFPTVRKGWDPAAVRAHLEALADRLPSGSASLADMAAERVSEIVAAAEATAAQIEADARREAEEALARAGEEARQRVEQAQAAVEGLVSQAEGLRAQVGSLGASGNAESAPESEEPEAEAPSAEPKPSPASTEPEPAATTGDEDPGPTQDAGDDAGAARLVAMNMALEGAGREEIRARIAADFAPLDGTEELVDEVLERAGRD